MYKGGEENETVRLKIVKIIFTRFVIKELCLPGPLEVSRGAQFQYLWHSLYCIERQNDCG
jgi:hypothetical protein